MTPNIIKKRPINAIKSGTSLYFKAPIRVMAAIPTPAQIE